MRRLRAESGRFVILVGPDGVGKTTVARALITRHGPRAAYFHFLPPIRGPLAPTPGNAPPLPKATAAGSRSAGWIRLLKNAVKCWAGYLKTIRPALKRRWLVVGDRWMYGYVAQPAALKFYGPEGFARTVLRLLPRPHLVANLVAPPELIRRRKQELSLRQIEQELRAWSALRLPNVQAFDATQSPEVIADAIMAVIAPVDRAHEATPSAQSF